MIAVFVNCISVLAGSFIGLIFSRKFSDELSEKIQTGAGIITIVIGLEMALEYQNIVYLALSLIIGGIIGHVLDIDGKILNLGKLLEKIFLKKSALKENEFKNTDEVKNTKIEDSKSKKNFAYAFLNSSVLFCVGAMAVVGSFKAGVEKDYTIIFTKSILDGFMAISFAAAMGIGTAFSTLIIFIYQGALTLLSVVIQPYVSEILLTEISACGGALILMIGINLLGLKKIKTADFLPALIIEILFVIFVPIVKNLFS